MAAAGWWLYTAPSKIQSQVSRGGGYEPLTVLLLVPKPLPSAAMGSGLLQPCGQLQASFSGGEMDVLRRAHDLCAELLFSNWRKPKSGRRPLLVCPAHSSTCCFLLCPSSASEEPPAPAAAGTTAPPPAPPLSLPPAMLESVAALCVRQPAARAAMDARPTDGDRDRWAAQLGDALRGSIVMADHNRRHFVVRGADPRPLEQQPATGHRDLARYYAAKYGLVPGFADLPLLVGEPLLSADADASSSAAGVVAGGGGQQSLVRLHPEFVWLRPRVTHRPAVVAALTAAYDELRQHGVAGCPPALAVQGAQIAATSKGATAGAAAVSAAERGAEIVALQSALGHTFVNLELLAEALRYCQAPKAPCSPGDAVGYERLEKLGDRVVELAAALAVTDQAHPALCRLCISHVRLPGRADASPKLPGPAGTSPEPVAEVDQPKDATRSSAPQRFAIAMYTREFATAAILFPAAEGADHNTAVDIVDAEGAAAANAGEPTPGNFCYGCGRHHLVCNANIRRAAAGLQLGELLEALDGPGEVDRSALRAAARPG